MRIVAAAAALLLLSACSAAPEPAPQPAAVAPVTPDPRVPELEKTVGELLDRIEVLNARIQKLEAAAPSAEPAAITTASPAPAKTTRPAKAPPQTAGAALADRYRTALEMYGKGQVAQSRKLFQEVFDAEPTGELADNALYWIGETHFVAGEYAEAMEFYRRIANDFADQNKAPDAMFKTGLSLERLGDLKLARRAFEELIARYPYSTPASNAKLELKRIKY